MAILFDFYYSPTTDENRAEKDEKFHARVVGGETIDFKTMCKNICSRCTLTPSDINGVLFAIKEELSNELLAGNRVNIPGIGSFSLSLDAPKDANPNATHAQHIKVKRIEYRADAELKEKVKNEAVFTRSREKVHSAHLNIYEIDALLIDYFETHAFITRPDFEELCHLTRNTAHRHLKRLVDEGRLINSNTPHLPTYEPAKGYYGR